MRIVVLGKNGQVGESCIKSLFSQHHILCLGRDDYGTNFTRLTETIKHIKNFSPDIIINATAFTNVDLAQSDIESAYQLNTIIPSVIAFNARLWEALFIHFSTDYVFDGRQNFPYTENQVAHALNVYGQSKLEGEYEVLRINPQAVILRLSWVHAAGHGNFIVSAMHWLREKESISIVNDQWGIPTSACEVARAVSHLIDCYQQEKTFPRGIYHFASNGFCNRLECATLIKEILNKNGIISPNVQILPSTTDSFRLPALRPRRAILEHSYFEQTFSFKAETWQEGVKRTVLAELQQEICHPNNVPPQKSR